MNSLVSILVGVVLVLGVGSGVYWQVQSADVMQVEQPVVSQVATSTARVAPAVTPYKAATPVRTGTTTNASATTTATLATTTASGITALVVAQHSLRTDCWASINGSVYDLTSWIPKHPGGEQAIVQLCGKDGSSKFNGKHGGDASKTKILSGFKVGVLAQ